MPYFMNFGDVSYPPVVFHLVYFTGIVTLFFSVLFGALFIF